MAHHQHNQIPNDCMEIAPGRILPAITPLVIDNKQKPPLNLGLFFNFHWQELWKSFIIKWMEKGSNLYFIIIFFITNWASMLSIKLGCSRSPLILSSSGCLVIHQHRLASLTNAFDIHFLKSNMKAATSFEQSQSDSKPLESEWIHPHVLNWTTNSNWLDGHNS